MVDGQAGKGDKYRSVDMKRWDESYERIYGKRVPWFVQRSKRKKARQKT